MAQIYISDNVLYIVVARNDAPYCSADLPFLDAIRNLHSAQQPRFVLPYVCPSLYHFLIVRPELIRESVNEWI
jgi:hypothetical protein